MDETKITGPLDSARVVACLAQDANTRADCLRSLAETAYTAAHGLHAHRRFDVGINAIRRSIDLIQLALDTLQDKKRLETVQAWKDCLIKRPSKYDVLGACLFSSDRREVSNYCEMKATQISDCTGRYSCCL